MNTLNPFTRIPSVAILLLLVSIIAGCGTGPDNESGNLFDSGTIAADGTFSFTFEDEGTVEYYCKFHEPEMQGEVTVASGTQNTNPDTVEMIDLRFNPSQLTVAPNTEVVWINRDNTSHTVTSGNPPADTDGGY